jgi:hypothetical protein
MVHKTGSIKASVFGVITITLGLLVACGGTVLTPLPPTEPTPAPAATLLAEPTVVPAVPTPEPTPQSEPTPTPLDPTVTPLDSTVGAVEFAIYKLNPGNDEARILQDNGTMNQKDLYGVYFKPVEDPYYIYILQQDSTDAVDVIFPNDSFSAQTNPVPAGKEVWVPRDFNNWFYLDENKGQEAILLVATRERNAGLEELVLSPPQPGEVSKDDFREALRQSLINSQEASASRGIGGVVQKKASALIFPDGNIRNVDVAAIGGSVDYVYKIGFEHK